MGLNAITTRGFAIGFLLSALGGIQQLRSATDLAQEAMGLLTPHLKTYVLKCGGLKSPTPGFQDGDLFFTGVVYPWFEMLTPKIHYQSHNDSLLIQLRNANYYYSDKRLTPAEQLNGLEWAGRVYLFAPLVRAYDEGWQKWLDRNNDPERVEDRGILFHAWVERNNGKWSFQEEGWQESYRPIKMTCDEIRALK